jgi:outer membrane protein insertion porin family
MGRTALQFGRARIPYSRYTTFRGGVKAAWFARALACALLLCPFTAAFAQDGPAAPAPYLNRIHITGHKLVAESELRARMRSREPSMFSIFRKPRLDAAQIDRDIVQLEAYYHSVGFPDATVRLDRIAPLENGRFADVHIVVVEGEPIRVASLEFDGELVLAETELRRDLLLAPGAPYNASLLETDLYRIRNRYYDQGYLGVLIADSVRVDNRRAEIRFTIDPGRQLRVGAVSIEGNQEVHTGVLESEIVFKSGDVCRYGRVLETERNLFETGLFSVVDVIPENVNADSGTVDIRIRVRERRESWVEVGFGVGNLLGSRVFAEWGTRNLAGTGRTLRFKAEYAFDLFRGDDIDPDQIDVKNTFYRYDAIYQQRRILGLKLPSALNAYVEHDATVQNIEVNTIGAAIGVAHEFGRIRDFGREGRVVGGFAVEEITRSEAEKPEEKSRSHILGASVSRDSRDFVLNPTMGVYRVLAAEVAGGVLGGDNDFYTTSANYQHYHGFAGGRVFAWRARAGYADAYGRTDVVPVENRYFLGGGNSVRGYDDSGLGPRDESGNVTGGEFMLLANAELRFPLPYFGRWNFGGAFFFDSGGVWGKVADVDAGDFTLVTDVDETGFDDYRYGVGLGLRYHTPVGPIRIDYGYPLKPDRYTLAGGSFYFSLGQIF